MEITNTEMAAAWEGEADHWIRAADRYDSAGAAIWQTFLDQGHVAATDRVVSWEAGLLRIGNRRLRWPDDEDEIRLLLQTGG